LCCRYFALPIDNPDTAKDFDDIRWYLCHENVVVFVEKRQWYVGILNRCKHLLDDNRCGIYENRPDICRGYSTKDCDYHGGDYGFSKLFTSAEQLREYAIKRLKRQGRWKPKKGDKVLLGPEPGMNGNGRVLHLPVLRLGGSGSNRQHHVSHVHAEKRGAAHRR
jgi:Fe-S-cluster containining protein